MKKKFYLFSGTDLILPLEIFFYIQKIYKYALNNTKNTNQERILLFNNFTNKFLNKNIFNINLFREL